MPTSERDNLYRRLRQAKVHLQRVRERLRLGLQADTPLSPTAQKMYDDAVSQTVVLQQRMDALLDQCLADNQRWPERGE